jgi:hypothetical protein
VDEKASANGRAKGNSPARQRWVCAEMFSKQRNIGVITGGEKEEFDKRRRAAVSWSPGAGRRCRWGRVIDADAESGSFSQAARGGPSLERVLTMEPETALEAGKRPRALPDGESSEERVLRRRVYAATFGGHGPETRTGGLGEDGWMACGRYGRLDALAGGGIGGREMVLVLMDIREQAAAATSSVRGASRNRVCHIHSRQHNGESRMRRTHRHDSAWRQWSRLQKPLKPSKPSPKAWKTQRTLSEPCGRPSASLHQSSICPQQTGPPSPHITHTNAPVRRDGGPASL